MITKILCNYKDSALSSELWNRECSTSLFKRILTVPLNVQQFFIFPSLNRAWHFPKIRFYSGQRDSLRYIFESSGNPSALKSIVFNFDRLLRQDKANLRLMNFNMTLSFLNSR